MKTQLCVYVYISFSDTGDESGVYCEMPLYTSLLVQKVYVIL